MRCTAWFCWILVFVECSTRAEAAPLIGVEYMAVRHFRKLGPHGSCPEGAEGMKKKKWKQCELHHETLNGELCRLKRSVLRRIAALAVTSQRALDEADDSEDPKASYIHLIVECQRSSASQRDCWDKGVTLATFRVATESMPPSELRQTAQRLGVRQEKIDDADDSENRRDALRAIVLAARAQELWSSGPHGNPSFEAIRLCGIRQEDGIRLLRYCASVSRCDSSYLYTESLAANPKWGASDDWTGIRDVLLGHCADGSAMLPFDVWAVTAAHFRDFSFKMPDPVQECVLVCGGATNSYGNEDAFCHFMPFVSAEQLSMLPTVAANRSWGDMISAVASRNGGECTLVDSVREKGDCYFHSVLVLLHFKDVLLQNPPSVFYERICACATPDPDREWLLI